LSLKMIGNGKWFAVAKRLVEKKFAIYGRS
jgi:hypothetical protein